MKTMRYPQERKFGYSRQYYYNRRNYHNAYSYIPFEMNVDDYFRNVKFQAPKSSTEDHKSFEQNTTQTNDSNPSTRPNSKEKVITFTKAWNNYNSRDIKRKEMEIKSELTKKIRLFQMQNTKDVKKETGDEVLKVNIKLKTETKCLTLRKNENLFLASKRFIEDNKLKEDLIVPITHIIIATLRKMSTVFDHIVTDDLMGKLREVKDLDVNKGAL